MKSNKLGNLLAGLMILCPAALGEVIFTLDPVGGAIAGSPGETDIGWGFTLFNDTDFALVTSADYLTGTPLGIFSDYISTFQFVIAGPSPESTSVTQSFDNTAFTGVGQYAIDGGAVVGAHSDGLIRLTYDLYSVSPNDMSFDPGADLISSGNIVSAPASVDVLAAAPPASAPEPDSVLLFASALLCVAGHRFRK